jgi:hypothetical protein
MTDAEYKGVTIDPDDPYGSLIIAIRDLISDALTLDGLMSEGEYGNIKAIEEFIRERDNS